jgi:biofilm PGA synthesis lipoprotein PgaB
MLVFFLSAFMPVQAAAESMIIQNQEADSDSGCIAGTLYRLHDTPPLLAAQVDLDYVYDTNIAQQRQNLALLVKRVCQLGVTTVLLQAFADPDGNGVADALYFPNRFLPMRGDLFATAARELQQCGVAVYAWMPLLAFIPGKGMEGLYVLEKRSTGAQRSHSAYHRLSPFNPVARNIIRGIYEDLAQFSSFDGILFHDDGMLSDYEDASPAALSVYGQAGFPGSIASIQQDDRMMARWSCFKTKYLINFSRSLLDIVRKYHPSIRSARNLYALTILQQESQQWLAQSLPLFLQAYDYTFIMAMPYMEKARNIDRWLENLVVQSLGQAVNPASVVFELQTVNWRQKKQIPTAEIIGQLSLLQQHGAVSFAYYPDDFHQNHPQLKEMSQRFSKMKRAWITNRHD